MPKLVIEKGPDKGKIISISEKGSVTTSVVIGREVTTWRLSDPLASRAHFKVEQRGSDFFLVDLDSLNGTYLNGRRVREARLKRGDKIQIGENIFTFVGDEEELKTDPLVNQVIAGYKIVERIGRGGMGTVYKAVQLSLNRTVAFKVLSEELTKDKNFINLFFQEARAAAQLNHPNIIQVYDVVNSGDIYFISMEFLPNGSIHDLLIKQKKLPLDRAIKVIIDAAKGLEYAEKKNIVHRDIKPDNLMLSEDFTAKIGDLGLAKQMQERQSKEERGIFGTPHYIAPEQALGKFTDHRADIYSLGSTFYRLLAGFPPYSGNSVKEIIMKKLESEPKPLHQIDSNIPPSVVYIIEKMMKKNVEERYQSASEVIKDLEEINKTLIQTQPSTVVIPEKKIRVASLAAIILFLMIAFGLGAYFLIIDKKEQKQDTGNEHRPPVLDGTTQKTTPRELIEQASAAFHEAENLYKNLANSKNPEKLREVISAYKNVLQILTDYPDDRYYVNSRAIIDELTNTLILVEGEIELDKIIADARYILKELFSKPSSRDKIEINEKINPLIDRLENFVNTKNIPIELINKANSEKNTLVSIKDCFIDFEKEFTETVQNSSDSFSKNKFYEAINVWKDFDGFCFKHSVDAPKEVLIVIDYFRNKGNNEKKVVEQKVDMWFTNKLQDVNVLVDKNQFDDALKELDELEKIADKIPEEKSNILIRKSETIQAKAQYEEKAQQEIVNKDKLLLRVAFIKVIPKIFSYKYDEALKQFKEVEPKVVTENGKERYRKYLFTITSEKLLFDKFCEVINSGKLKNNKIELPSTDPKKFWTGKITKIDSDRVIIALDVGGEIGKNLNEISTDSIYKLMSNGWNQTPEENIFLAMFCLRRGMIAEAEIHYEKAKKSELSNDPKTKKLLEGMTKLMDEDKVEFFRNAQASLIGESILKDTTNLYFPLEEKLELLKFLEGEFDDTPYLKKNKKRIKSEIDRIKKEIDEK